MVLPLIAAGIGAAASFFGARGRNKQQVKMAREQMAFQERMSSTAYTRSMADMKRAGLNPMLAFQQGGASSPGGAQAKIEDVVSPAVNSAVAGLRLKNEIAMNRAQVKLLGSQEFKTRQEGIEAMSRAAAMQAAPQTGADRSTYYRRGQLAQWSRQELESKLLAIGVPAAKVRGSTMAALWQVYGKAIAGGVGGAVALRFGRGFMTGRRR